MLISRLHTVSIVLYLGSTLWCSPLFGQYRVGLEVGAARFWGVSRDTGGDHASFRPYRPTTFGIGLERQTDRYAVALHVRYSQASLALEGPEAAVAAEGVFKLVSVAPELAIRLATLGPGNQLRLHAGPLLEVWDIIDQDARTRFGAQTSISLDIPLGGRFDGVVLAGVSVTRSPYQEGELDIGGSAPTYELRAQWRRSFAGGLRYRL
jgi:hypothetical protein